MWMIMKKGLEFQKESTAFIQITPFLVSSRIYLRILTNIVKMERLVLYRESNNLEETDSSFHLRRMKELYYRFVQQIGTLSNIKINQIYEINLINQQKICLSTDLEHSIKRKFVTEWIYPILKLFTVDTFLDIFTLTML